MATCFPSRHTHLLGALLAAVSLSVFAATPDTMEQRAKACTGCHGPQGQSRPDGYVPRLAGKPAGYLFAQMRNFRDGRRTHVTMAGLLENLDDAMLRELATWFAAQEVPYPQPASALPPPAAARRAETLVRQGDVQREIPACTGCHGEALTGIAPHVPGLVGLPRDYLVAQLGAWRQDARRAPAPDCMATVAHRLAADDVAFVSQWLAAQPVPAPAKPATQAPATWPMQCGVFASDAPAPAAVARDALAERGAYLARVGNCAGCHTAPGGAPWAGGLGIPTPFGAVYTTNLTPDDATGLGRWTADDFWRAMHEGRSRDGRRLTPAFPYTSYTHVTRADSDAIFAYLRTLPAVKQPARPSELRFPFNTQAAIAAWQWLYFEPGSGAPRGADAQLARGEYLVKGLGHCDACHAPRNRFGAPADSLAGGVIPGQGWYAPSLHPTARDRVDGIVELLRTGRNAHGSVTGPMAGVVRQSTQHWTDADLRAAATYLASLAPVPSASSAPRARSEVMDKGGRLYADRCADCHGADGRGSPGAAPPLAGNPSVLAPDIGNLVKVLRHGAFGPATATVPRPYGMPPQDLDDAQAAAVLTWLRQSWGNQAAAVEAVDVARIR